jgi:hypothetical protein
VTDVIDGLGEAEVRVSKSQIAFRARRGFAYVWRPGRYVDNDVQPYLEIRDLGQVDEEVARWLRDAYDAGS